MKYLTLAVIIIIGAIAFLDFSIIRSFLQQKYDISKIKNELSQMNAKIQAISDNQVILIPPDPKTLPISPVDGRF